jgi:hypothetical protein
MSSTTGPTPPSPGLLREATLKDLELASPERAAEGNELLKLGFGSSALALRLYSLEIYLKVIICKHLGFDFLPRACKTHDLAELLIFTGRLAELEDPTNIMIRQNWDLLVKFSKDRLNDQRYVPSAQLDAALLNRLMSSLDDPKDGVLKWLSKHP